MLKKLFKHFLNDNTRASLILILVGTIIWSLTMIKSGLVYSYGMGFWGPNGHDGIWHISLAEGLSRGSWEMSMFAGEAIRNYHLGFDIILAVLHKLTFIPVRILYFQILPPILAFLIGYFAYKFVYSWKRSHLQALTSVFFVYFGGSWGWMLTGIRNKELGGESMFWSQQSISTLINPPFALSLVFLFAGLYFLRQGMKDKTKSRWRLVLVTFLFGSLVQIKVYAGILVLGGLFVSGIWMMLQRKGIALIKVFTGALIVSILLIAPITKEIGQVVVFKPFWFLETIMSDPARLYWPKFAEAMINYKLAGNWIKGIPAYTVAFLIFWFGNLGTRIIKEVFVFKWIKRYKRLTSIEAFIATVIVAGVTIPMFFIQSGTPWNTIQFTYYSLVFSGILAGVTLGGWLERVKKGFMSHISIYVTLAIVFLTLPTTFGTLKHYLPARPPAKISSEELEALKFLKAQPDGVVLTQPFDREAAEKAINNPPRPLYLYESTAYVSAFTGKQVYLEDEVNLEITGYEWRQRRERTLTFFGTKEIELAKEFLNENDISYIYLVNGQRTRIDVSHLEIVKIFENSYIVIYRVVFVS